MNDSISGSEDRSSATESPKMVEDNGSIYAS